MFFFRIPTDYVDKIKSLKKFTEVIKLFEYTDLVEIKENKKLKPKFLKILDNRMKELFPGFIQDLCDNITETQKEIDELKTELIKLEAKLKYHLQK